MTTLWVLLAIVAVLALWGIAVYNRLRQLHNRVDNAWSQIDVQLKRRYDLIPNLVEVARRYLAHESQTLEAVIANRYEVMARYARGVRAAVQIELDALKQRKARSTNSARPWPTRSAQ